MENIILDTNELSEKELQLADALDQSSKLTYDQLRLIEVKEMVEMREDKETGESYPIGLLQDSVKVFLRKELKVQGHPSLGGVYIYNRKLKLWRLERAPQAVIVDSLTTILKETFNWKFLPNNRFTNDISKAVKDYLAEVAPLYGEDSPLIGSSLGHLIAFNNGTYNFRTNTIEETIPEHYQTMKLPYDLIQPEENEHLLANDWLEWLVGESALTIKQLIGFSLHRSYDHIGAYALFINGQGTSNGQNGKSQVLSFIDLLLGAGEWQGHNPNTIDLGLDQLTGRDSRFMRSQLRGHLVNIKDDENDTFIEKTGELKNMTSGGMITSDVKGKDAVSFRSQTKFIMGMNKLPSFRDDSEGMRSRMIIVPFNKYLGTPEEMAMFKGEDAPFSNEKRNKYMFAPEYLGKFAWECIQDFRKAYDTHERNPFYISEQAQEMIDGLMINNDPLENFLNDSFYEITGDKDDMVVVETFMEEYLNYSNANAKSINNIKQDLENRGVITRIRNGVTTSGATKYRSIKRKFKDTDNYTSTVWLGIKKVEE